MLVPGLKRGRGSWAAGGGRLPSGPHPPRSPCPSSQRHPTPLSVVGFALGLREPLASRPCSSPLASGPSAPTNTRFPGPGDTRGLPSQTRHIPHSPQVHPAVGLGEATKPLGAMAFLAENRGDNRKDPVRSTRDLMSLCPPRAGHSPRLPASPLSGRQSRPSSRMCGRAHGQQAVSGVAFPDLCFRPLGHAPEVFLCSSIRMYSFGKLVILQILAERLLGAGLYRMRGVRRGGRTDLGLPWPRSRSSLAPFPLPPHPNRTLFQGIGWDVFPSCWMASFIHQ